MRLVDVTLAFPPIFLAMAVAAALGPGLRNAFFAMVIVWWPIYARLMRGQVQAVKHRDHIQAAVSIGATRWRILRKHVLPLSFTPALINATLDLGQVVHPHGDAQLPRPRRQAAVAGVGRDDHRGRAVLLPVVDRRRARASPSSRSVLAFNFLGDGLRDSARRQGQAVSDT